MQLGKYRDAAEHLTYYESEYPADQDRNKLARAKQLLEEAKKHVGTLEISVDTPGVDVFVDGKVVGQSPLTSPVFVDPGKRLVEVQRGQSPRTQTVDVSAGNVYAIHLQLAAPLAPSSSPIMPSILPSTINWKVAVSGGLGIAGVATGIGLLVKASIIDTNAAEFRAQHHITGKSDCLGQQTDSCRTLHTIAQQKIPYSLTGLGAIALGVGGIGYATYTYVRGRNSTTTPRIGFRVFPGPMLQIDGSF